MDFDEYEYLEKAVEDPDSSSKKENGNDKERKSSERSDRSYRKRDGDRSIDDVQEDGARRSEDRKSKRSRGDDDRSSRDRDRHRRDRDRDRERSHRDKDKEKDRGEKEKDRDREKRREKDRELERERDRERERERERRSRSASRKRESDRERELIRERERELETRESRRFKDKKEMEPEADPERDQRTVFAYQMPLKATERDVYEFFSKAGKVRDVRLIMDRNSRRSKGVGNAIMMGDDGNTLHSCFINSCCVLKASDSSKETQLEFPALEFLFPYISLLNALYIEFYDVMSVPMAIALCGQLLLGQPVMVKPSEAEKNLVQSTAAGSTGGLTGPYGAVDRKLYVGNLHFSITETQLREIFEAFGPVELVQLPLDIETGQCKGFGFVQFSHLEHAKAAQTLNGKLEIAGRVVKVSSVTDHVGAQETGAKSADFDDDDGGGLSLNAQSRALLMQKLDRTGTATSIVGSLGVPALNGAAPIQQTLGLPINGQAALPLPVLPAQVLPTPVSEPVGNPSECLLLKNMFDPETEDEPDFDLDIKDDVGEECSKYGRVKHIYVDKNSAGFVYVRFDTTEAAMAAQRAMHMRWFARRLISALYMQPQDYEAKFGAGA